MKAAQGLVQVDLVIAHFGRKNYSKFIGDVHVVVACEFGDVYAHHTAKLPEGGIPDYGYVRMEKSLLPHNRNLAVSCDCRLVKEFPTGGRHRSKRTSEGVFSIVVPSDADELAADLLHGGENVIAAAVELQRVVKHAAIFEERDDMMSGRALGLCWWSKRHAAERRTYACETPGGFQRTHHCDGSGNAVAASAHLRRETLLRLSAAAKVWGLASTGGLIPSALGRPWPSLNAPGTIPHGGRPLGGSTRVQEAKVVPTSE